HLTRRTVIWFFLVRLLLVNHEFPPVGGGAATASYEIAHNLAALGHQVTVLTGGFSNLPRTEKNQITVRRVKCIRRKLDRSNLFEMFTFAIGAVLGLPCVLRRYRTEALIVFFSVPSGLVGLVRTLF